MPPEQPEQETQHIEKGEEAPLEHGDEERPKKPVESPETAATRLTEEYIAKGKEEEARGQQAVTKAVENGKKEGLQIS